MDIKLSKTEKFEINEKNTDTKGVYIDYIEDNKKPISILVENAPRTIDVFTFEDDDDFSNKISIEKPKNKLLFGKACENTSIDKTIDSVLKTISESNDNIKSEINAMTDEEYSSFKKDVVNMIDKKNKKKGINL